jgi:hypothetical protein
MNLPHGHSPPPGALTDVAAEGAVEEGAPGKVGVVLPKGESATPALLSRGASGVGELGGGLSSSQGFYAAPSFPPPPAFSPSDSERVREAMSLMRSSSRTRLRRPRPCSVPSPAPPPPPSPVSDGSAVRKMGSSSCAASEGWSDARRVS